MPLSKALPRVARLSKLVGAKDAREALHAGTQIYVNFMSLTRRSGWLQGHIAKQSQLDEDKAERARLALLTAASRHLTFSDLFKSGETLGRGSTLGAFVQLQKRIRHLKLQPSQAVPTRDVSVVWCADLLRPQIGAVTDHLEDEDAATAWYDHQHLRMLQSGARFEKATGRKWSMFASGQWPLWEEGARTTSALRRFDSDASGIVTASERNEALTQWQANYDATAAAFEWRTGTSYRVPPGQMPPDADLGALQRATPPLQAERAAATVAQLADAVVSQSSFVGRILALGPRIITDAWIDRAITRYAEFLSLAKAHPGKTLVPTLDIDLIWHAHMLSPLDYRDDCHDMFGRVLSHDDQKGASELEAGFHATAERWHAAHGTPYVWRAKTTQPTTQQHSHTSTSSPLTSYSGCGSCGWGDEAFHSLLEHTEAEAELIEATYGGDGGGSEAGEGASETDVTTTARSADGEDGLVEMESWAVDAPLAPGADASLGGRMEDPWAAPPCSTDAGANTHEGSATSDSSVISSGSSPSSSSSSSSSSSHGWGWGSGGDSSSDSGSSCSSCGGGCGGD